ncbi:MULTISPECIES: trp operon leader peptide [Vibrio]|nr:MULTISPECIES: trp operon leader peptide [Vibrio]NAW58163.1 Trp operon leader peptide [Vibrio sp. V36_P2S2PM302]NAX22008.1 Trp operon leader peptide [Vibrio sp. V39_P1S14PM300]NAX27976.1 Trp operon leader peptide [Vibrio sp. V38_P2S17PM301]NAX30916.1 Trp operon leader peptide [Vibrio sp. V37_P2S8PM304]
MLQEFNQNQNDKVSVDAQASAELNWWRTWTSSWWANVYF